MCTFWSGKSGQKIKLNAPHHLTSKKSKTECGNKRYCNQKGVDRGRWCTSTSESLNTVLQHQCHDRANLKGDSNNTNAVTDRPVEKRWNLTRPDGVVWHERTSRVVHVSPKIPVAKSLSQPWWERGRKKYIYKEVHGINITTAAARITWADSVNAPSFLISSTVHFSKHILDEFGTSSIDWQLVGRGLGVPVLRRKLIPSSGLATRSLVENFWQLHFHLSIAGFEHLC